MSRNISWVCALAVMLAISNGLPLWGQAVANATIAGTVADPNGGVVPNARLTATQIETGMVRNVATGVDGTYVLANLPVGPYTLEVGAAGFTTRVVTGIVLQVGNSITINAKLEIGSVSEHVQVQATAAMVETQQTSVSQVVDQQRIVDLPLNGRQATQLILLSGAATTTPPGDLVSSKNYPSSVTMSVAGGQGNGTNYLMDGGANNDPWSGVNLPFPFPDALQEFSVENSSLTARYGVHPGGTVNVVTKSGTNAFHGSLFEFVRNGDANARNFFAASQDTLRRNQFGGAIGGPVLKDKLFFFFGYQGTRTRTTPPQTISFVPTQAAAGGNFSVLESAACQSSGKGKSITDPSTNQPFPGNVIGASRLNPVALAVLKNIPVASDPCGKTVYGIPNPQNENQEIGRFDYNITSTHAVFGRYFITKFNAPDLSANGNLLLTTQASTIDRSESATVGDNYSISANAINSAHVTWNRTQIGRSPAPGLTDPNSVGINMFQAVPNFLLMSISGYFSVGCGSCAPAAFNRASTQVADDFDLIRGRHHFAFGGEWMHTLLNSFNVFNGNGNFSFNGQSTGDSLADFMLGLPATLTQGNVSRGNYRQDYIGFYAQDTFRVNSHFNLNYGVRWEPFLPAADTNDRGGSFNAAAFAAGQKSSLYTSSPAGLFFVGDTGIPRGYAEKRYGEFGPRVGVVWDPKGDGKQTLRAGYGLFYESQGLFFSTGFNSQAPWGSTISLASPPGGLSSPYTGAAGGNPFPIPTPPTKNQVFPVAGTYITLPLGLKPTTMQQYNLSYSRQLSKDWMVSATYMGNASRHIWAGMAINPSVYIPGNCNGSPCSSTKNTNQRRVFYLENPAQGQYYASIVSAFDGANAEYNAIIFSARKRFSSNYTVMANYTYSHCISEADFAGDISATAATFEQPNNLRADRGNCGFDLRHNVNISMVADAPAFHQRWEQAVLGGWQLSPIIQYRTGFWFSPLSGVDNSLTGVNLDRPNVTSDPYSRNMTTLQWLNASAFSQNGTGTFGNAGRDSLEGPGSFTFDTALSRRFPIRESQRLELRFEFFNVMNHARFSNPSGTVNVRTFGQILAAGDPRILQFAMKYTF